MKKLISAALALMLLISFSSCKKTALQVVDPALHNPQIIARIYPTVNQPTDAVLGESSALFGVGDKVVVYVPYQIANDEISTADLIIKEAGGEMILRTPLTMSFYPDQEGLNVPDELKGSPFLYGTIDVDGNFASKNFILSIEVRGTNSGFGADQIDNAFSVLP